MINKKRWRDVFKKIGNSGKIIEFTKKRYCYCSGKKEKKIVFLTTTVKILPINKKYGFVDITIPNIEKERDVFSEIEITSFLLNLEKNLNNSNNIYVLGIYDRKIGKIISLSPKILEDISGKCDYMIIEGDGSKMKPLKGWNKTEPVYTKNTTKSVGILPINII